MGKRHASAPSTEKQPFGLALDQLSAEFRRDVSQLFGMPADVASLRERLADPQRVATALSRLSGRALIVLDHLLELGGHVETEELVSIAVNEHGMKRSELEAAVAELSLSALAIAVQTTESGRPPYAAVATFDVLEELLVARVRGLALPAPPVDAPTVDVWLRDLAALLASVVHLPMKITQHGDVHRGTAKKLANVVGWPADQVTLLLDLAIGVGVLGRRGDALAPVLPRLFEVARGELTLSTDSDALSLLRSLPERRWIALNALGRALAAHRMASLLRTYPQLRATSQRRALLRREVRKDIASLPLQRLVVGEHVFVRRPSPGPRTGQGDGHVTPSFEVMLGPAADPELVATVALCTEPSRFDVVLTRKITPASVTAGCAAGLDVHTMLDALGRVGKHRLPDNVRTMVEEWAQRAKTLRIRDVWALEVSSPEAADVIARTLDGDVVARPSPTVLLVNRSVTSLATRVQKLGVQVLDAVEPLAMRGERPPGARFSPAELAYLDEVGDPALRARVERRSPSEVDVEDTPEHVFDTLVDVVAALPPEAKTAHAFLDVLRRLWEAAIPEYAKWTAQLAPEAARKARDLPLDRPWLLVPWLVRAPRKRAKLLAGAKNVEQLLAAAMALKDGDSLTTDGMEAVRLAKHPEILSRVYDASASLERGPKPHEASPAPEPAKRAPRAPAAKKQAAQLPLAALPTSPADQTFEEKKAAFLKAAAEGARVILRVRVPGQPERSVTVQPERVVERGNDVAFLALDVEEDEGRSFPVVSVIAVEPA